MELKTKLCTERIIDASLEEKDMSEKSYNPLRSYDDSDKQKNYQRNSVYKQRPGE